MDASNRRGFIKKLGLLGAIIGGTAAASTRQTEHVVESTAVLPDSLHADTPSVKEDISHLAPDQNTTLVLQGNPKPVDTLQSSSSDRFYIRPMFQPTEYQNKVQLSVGKDDRLWIKIGDEWKRVAIE